MIALFVLIGATGCGGSSGSDLLSGIACTAEVRPGVVVTITDTRTGAFPANFTGLRVTLTDGDYSSDLVPTSFTSDGKPVSLSGAYERAGTYTVHVEAPGYVSQDINNISVTKGVCHVNTVNVPIALAPQ